jgi:(2Fe-2S) ferredoxin
MSEDFFLGTSNRSKEAFTKLELNKIRNIDDLAKKLSRDTYVEAQIYGVVDLKDVESIFVQSVKKGEEIKKALVKAGYPDIKVLPLQYDSRLKLLTSNSYSGPGVKYASSLLPSDIDNLGNSYVDSLFERWTGTAKSVIKNKGEKSIPAELHEGIIKNTNNTDTISDRREWLKKFYELMQKKESGGLPKVWYEDVTKGYGGWTDDVINKDLLKK